MFAKMGTIKRAIDALSRINVLEEACGMAANVSALETFTMIY